MKRIAGCICLCILMLVCACAPVFAASEPVVYHTDGQQDDSYSYTLDGQGNATIVGWKGERDIDILYLPETLDGHPVTGLGLEYFSFWDVYISEVNIPSNIVNIVGDPFGPSDVIISPDHPTLEIVDNVLFDKAQKRLIAYLRNGADYSIPQGTRSIGEGAFSYAVLMHVTIPDSVTSIGRNAFAVCTELEDITIPDSVTDIDGNPFSRCPQLRLTVSPTHPTLEVVDNVLFDKVEKRLISYIGHRLNAEYVIPMGTAQINADAFKQNYQLERITIPDSVTKIDGNPFNACYPLQFVVSPTHPTLEVVDGVLFDKAEKRLIFLSVHQG